jgi:hypothetical protein
VKKLFQMTAFYTLQTMLKLGSFLKLLTWTLDRDQSIDNQLRSYQLIIPDNRHTKISNKILNDSDYRPSTIETQKLTHCKDTIQKILNKYSKKRNCTTTVAIPTFMFLRTIYIVGIFRSKDT